MRSVEKCLVGGWGGVLTSEEASGSVGLLNLRCILVQIEIRLLCAQDVLVSVTGVSVECLVAAEQGF